MFWASCNEFVILERFSGSSSLHDAAETMCSSVSFGDTGLLVAMSSRSTIEGVSIACVSEDTGEVVDWCREKGKGKPPIQIQIG